MTKKTKNFSIRLDSKDRKRVEQIAQEHGLSIVDVIRLCVKMALPSVLQENQKP